MAGQVPGQASTTFRAPLIPGSASSDRTFFPCSSQASDNHAQASPSGFMDDLVDQLADAILQDAATCLSPGPRHVEASLYVFLLKRPSPSQDTSVPHAAPPAHWEMAVVQRRADHAVPWIKHTCAHPVT